MNELILSDTTVFYVVMKNHVKFICKNLKNTQKIIVRNHFYWLLHLSFYKGLQLEPETRS